MSAPHKSEDYKLSAVKHYLTSGKSQEEICDIFKCSARSLMRWVDRFQTEKSMKRKHCYSELGTRCVIKTTSQEVLLLLLLLIQVV